MENIQGLRAFVQVVASGGFSRAAAKSGVSKSIVSRRVGALEKELGVRLLSRTTRGISLTDAGTELNARALKILAELDEALDAASGRDGAVAGTLKISAPLSFGISHLSRPLAEFAARHPAIHIDLAYSDRFVDLIAEGFDVAIRIGELKDSSLVARRLAGMHGVVVASPLYLARRGTPKHPRELFSHDFLTYSGSARGDVLRFRQGRHAISVRVQGRFRADNGDVLCDAAIAGLGITSLPSWITAPAIAAGSLVQLLPEFKMQDAGIYAVRPPGAAVSGKVRAFIDFLVEKFASNTDCDVLPP